MLSLLSTTPQNTFQLYVSPLKIKYPPEYSYTYSSHPSKIVIAPKYYTPTMQRSSFQQGYPPSFNNTVSKDQRRLLNQPKSYSLVERINRISMEETNAAFLRAILQIEYCPFTLRDAAYKYSQRAHQAIGFPLHKLHFNTTVTHKQYPFRCKVTAPTQKGLLRKLDRCSTAGQFLKRIDHEHGLVLNTTSSLISWICIADFGSLLFGLRPCLQTHYCISVEWIRILHFWIKNYVLIFCKEISPSLLSKMKSLWNRVITEFSNIFDLDNINLKESLLWVLQVYCEKKNLTLESIARQMTI